MIKYDKCQEFKKDLKKLTKRFKSLPDDLSTLKKNVIEMYHLKNINNLSTFEMQGYNHDQYSFWKIKKIACKSLKGKGVKSGLRIIYKYYKSTKEVIFIEIYFKGDKENEDKGRIGTYCV